MKTIWLLRESLKPKVWDLENSAEDLCNGLRHDYSHVFSQRGYKLVISFSRWISGPVLDLRGDKPDFMPATKEQCFHRKYQSDISMYVLDSEDNIVETDDDDLVDHLSIWSCYRLLFWKLGEITTLSKEEMRNRLEHGIRAFADELNITVD